MQSNPFPNPIDTDLLLVFPPFFRRIVSMESLGIEYMASSARSAGFKSSMINAGLHGLSLPDVTKLVVQSRFRVLGISTLHWNLNEGLRIAEAAKYCDPSCHIIFGGIEAALRADELISSYPSIIDSIAVGEGENIIVDLLTHLKLETDWKTVPGLVFEQGGELKKSGPAHRIDDLDGLPFPARDDISAVYDSGGPVAISTSRGCFAKCKFCSVMSFYRLSKGPGWIFRTPDSIVKELGTLYDDKGARLFSFIDETAIGSPARNLDRLRELAARIRDNNLEIEFFATVRADCVNRELFRELAVAGLRKVEIGVESMSETQLSRYGKTATVQDNQRALDILDELGIRYEAYMMPFDEEATWEEIDTNFKFFRERFSSDNIRYDVGPLGIGDYVYPYQGTAASKTYADMGWSSKGSFYPFHSNVPSIMIVQRVIHRYIAHMERSFPMSYMGFGNLWVNSRHLPQDIYHRICEISSRFGDLVLDFAEWIREQVDKGLDSNNGIKTLSSSFRIFVADFAELHKQMGQIRTAVDQLRSFTYKKHQIFPNEFSIQVYSYGRQERRKIIDAIFETPLFENDVWQDIMEELNECASLI